MKILAKIFMFDFYFNMNNTNISFKSNIRFIDRNTYNKLKKVNYITFWHDAPNILKAKEFYSEGIKTCTAGGVINSQQEAAGFHILDDKINKKNFNTIITSLFESIKKPNRALLIGSKELKDDVYSIEQFKKFKQIFQKKIKNVSFFEQHMFENSQTHYHYDSRTDTWTLFSEYQKKPNGNHFQIKNLNRLKECFKNISIAEGDKLFICNKEITTKEAPEIFNN